jgi:hypothetical protein
MSTLALTRPAVKPTRRTARTADEVILWTVANRQAARESKDNRVGITADAWNRMTPPDRRAVGRRLVGLGCPTLGPDVTAYGRFSNFIDQCVNGVPTNPPANPRNSWPAWTNSARWTVSPDDDPRPTARPDFTPTRLDQLEYMGYELGNGGSESATVKGLDADELAAFDRGFARGQADLESERDACLEAMAIEHDAMEAMFGDPEHTSHPAELARVGRLA